MGVAALKNRGMLPQEGLPTPEIAEPKQLDHGDFMTSFALIAAKAAGKSPREVAEALSAAIPKDDLIESIEIAGPGFLNFRLSAAGVAEFLDKTLPLGEKLSFAAPTTMPKRINVEFVSVNPNGPITVGSGRGAAFGSTLCNVLEAAGHTVFREYYVNDGVNSEQMRQFADSVRSFVEGLPFPEKGYKGDYVSEVANEVKLIARPDGADIDWYQQKSQELMLARQKVDLESFGVKFDVWFSEQSLHDNGKVQEAIDKLVSKGIADSKPERTQLKLAKGGRIEDVVVEAQAGNIDDEGQVVLSEGAEPPLWLRSTKLGDDMDRVLRRGDGRLTYIASDIAYHADKFNRPPNATNLITVLGPDHHGYVGRLHAVVAAVELPDQATIPSSEPLDMIEQKIFRDTNERDRCYEALERSKNDLRVVIFQIVRFVKDGQPAPMRKRDGNIYSLRDLIVEIGKAAAPSASTEEQVRIGCDVSRFFYLMRSHDTHMDFDIDLATKQSDENPVFYCQYAHARICSVLAKAREELGDFLADENVNVALLTHEREKTLIKKICDLPWEVGRCAEDYGVHRLASYAIELARLFHHFYDACRVIQPDQIELSKARLALCKGTRFAITSVFSLLGVSAPERMDRAAQEE